MKIGIDAKWFFEGPVSNRIVVQQLLEQLIAHNQQHELHVFLNRQHRHLSFPFVQEKVHLHYVWAGNNQLSNLWVLPRIAQKLGIEVLLFQNFVSPWGAFKKVAYIHDAIPFSHPEFYTLKERLYFSTMPWLCRSADLIITISQNEKRRIERLFKYIPKVVSVYHGANPDFRPKTSFPPEQLASVKERYQLPERYLLFVGRLNIRKNIQNLLQALPLLHNKHIPLVIVGEKEWKSYDLEELIKQLGIENRIIFTGKTPYSDLLALYALAQVFCFPSFEEGFGLPPLEAMASALPVLVSEGSALPEVCGEAGLYINPHSPQDIAEKLNQILEDEAFYQQKQSLGLQQARKFTWQESARQVLQHLESLLS